MFQISKISIWDRLRKRWRVRKFVHLYFKEESVPIWRFSRRMTTIWYGLSNDIARSACSCRHGNHFQPIRFYFSFFSSFFFENIISDMQTLCRSEYSMKLTLTLNVTKRYTPNFMSTRDEAKQQKNKWLWFDWQSPFSTKSKSRESDEAPLSVSRRLTKHPKWDNEARKIRSNFESVL